MEIPSVTALARGRVGFSVRRVVGALAALLILLLVGLSTWQAGIRLEGLAALGYPGVFVVMLISGAGTFMPMPGQAAVLLAGAVWNPVIVGLTAGLGNATGELLGYTAGRAGLMALGERKVPRWWSTLENWIRRYGFWTILAIALVPNPVFDIVGLLAGSLGYPARRFWLACALGNSVKYVGYAYLGDVVRWWLG